MSNMESERPKYIDRKGLLERMSEESATLPARESAWWQAHRVDPFPARFAGLWHYVVARDANRVVFFADDEDEFGLGRLTPEDIIEDYGLVGDLKGAVSIILGPQA